MQNILVSVISCLLISFSSSAQSQTPYPLDRLVGLWHYMGSSIGGGARSNWEKYHPMYIQIDSVGSDRIAVHLMDYHYDTFSINQSFEYKISGDTLKYLNVFNPNHPTIAVGSRKKRYDLIIDRENPKYDISLWHNYNPRAGFNSYVWHLVLAH